MPWTGSLTSLSLSLMMRLGKPDIFGDDQRLLRLEEVSHAGVSLVEVVFVDALLFAGVCWDLLVSAPVKVKSQSWMTDPGPQAHGVGAKLDQACRVVDLTGRHDPEASSFLLASSPTTSPPSQHHNNIDRRRHGRSGRAVVAIRVVDLLQDREHCRRR